MNSTAAPLKFPSEGRKQNHKDLNKSRWLCNVIEKSQIINHQTKERKPKWLKKYKYIQERSSNLLGQYLILCELDWKIPTIPDKNKREIFLSFFYFLFSFTKKQWLGICQLVVSLIYFAWALVSKISITSLSYSVFIITILFFYGDFKDVKDMGTFVFTFSRFSLPSMLFGYTQVKYLLDACVSLFTTASTTNFSMSSWPLFNGVSFYPSHAPTLVYHIAVISLFLRFQCCSLENRFFLF